jgi:hypothetical protein
MSSCSGGIGHCTSLQELLLGFSSGALRLMSNEDSHLVEGVSCVEGIGNGTERNDVCFNAKTEGGTPDISLQQQYVESEEDNEHKYLSDETSYAASDTDNDETSNQNTQPEQPAAFFFQMRKNWTV